MMMALPQENVHHTLNSGPGVMNRVHARIQEFLSGGGGGGGGGWVGWGSRPDGQKTVWTMFFLVINLFTVYRGDPMVLLQRGGGVQLLPGGGGVQRNRYNL